MPSYLRLSKNEETITNNKKTSFNFLKPGKWVKLKVGKNKKSNCAHRKHFICIKLFSKKI